MAIKEILMNLQENIERIQSMMGINESELETSEKVLIYITEEAMRLNPKP